MMLLTFDNNINNRVLNDVIDSLTKYRLINNVFIQYKTTFDNYDFNNSEKVDFITIAIGENDKCEEIRYKDILKDILKKKRRVIFVNDKNIELTYIKTICDEITLKYIVLEELLNAKTIGITNLEFGDIAIIKDFLDEDINSPRFDKSSFAIKLYVDKNGNVFNKNILVDNITKVPFINIITKCNYIEEENNFNSSFGNYLYSPYYFLNENIDEMAIVEYKITLFNLIKDLSMEDYLHLPDELRELFAKRNYLNMKDILSIIKLEDKVLNDYY